MSYAHFSFPVKKVYRLTCLRERLTGGQARGAWARFPVIPGIRGPGPVPGNSGDVVRSARRRNGTRCLPAGAFPLSMK